MKPGGGAVRGAFGGAAVALHGLGGLHGFFIGAAQIEVQAGLLRRQLAHLLVLAGSGGEFTRDGEIDGLDLEPVQIGETGVILAPGEEHFPAGLFGNVEFDPGFRQARMRQAEAGCDAHGLLQRLGSGEVGAGMDVVHALAIEDGGLGRWLGAVAGPGAPGDTAGDQDNRGEDSARDSAPRHSGQGHRDGTRLAANGLYEVAGAGEPASGIGIERAEDGLFPPRVEIRRQGPRRRRCRFGPENGSSQRRARCERERARDHLVRHRAQRVNVGCNGSGAAAQQLGRHVVERPHHRAGLSGGGIARGNEAAGQAEIGHHRARAFGARDQHHVGWLEIAVDDARAVGGIEGFRHLLEQRQSGLGRQAALALDSGRQGFSRQKLHGKKEDDFRR